MNARPAIQDLSTVKLLRKLRVTAIVAVVFITAWFTIPAFQGTYTEGFEPTIGISAEGLLSGRMQDADLLYPFNGRFFLVTRLGVAIVLAGLHALDQLPTLMNFRAIMLGSLALLVGSIIYLLARIYRVPPTLGALACLMLPPIFESAYFFNDNVLSAGLSTVALVVFWTRLTLPATAVAAILLGVAAATRPDALFIAPAFATLMWFELPTWRARWLHALVAVPLVSLIPLAIYAAFGLSYLDIVAVAPRAIALWGRHESFATLMRHAVYGPALPGMSALPLGIASFLYRRRWREVCLCVLVPLLYAAVYGRSLYEMRYLLPLAPFIAISMAEGGRVALRSRGLPRVAFAVAFGLAFLAYVAPPVVPPAALRWRLARLGVDADGPRPLLGRVWSPLIWMLWLDQLNGGISALGDSIERDSHPGSTLVVVSAYWNPDRLFDLLLLEHGFTPQPDPAPDACRAIGEVFTRQGATVVHLRTHIPFLAGHREYVDWEQGGLPCLHALGADSGEALVLGWRPADFAALGTRKEDGAAEIYRPASRLPSWVDPTLSRQVYLISRTAIASVGNFLNRPLTPGEQRIAEELFRARTRLLQ